MRKPAIARAWKSFLSKFVKNTPKTGNLDNSPRITAINTPSNSLPGVENKDKQQERAGDSKNIEPLTALGYLKTRDDKDEIARCTRESVLSGKTDTLQEVQKDAKNKLSPELGDNCTPPKQPKSEINGEKTRENKCADGTGRPGVEERLKKLQKEVSSLTERIAFFENSVEDERELTLVALESVNRRVKVLEGDILSLTQGQR